jgi:hypothetical protein
MIASPYGFLRGSAVVMAHDVAQLPSTGITPVVCGDCHLGNFGFYASPERELVIDLNDFDEAHPGAWEWDLRRLAASIWLPDGRIRSLKSYAARPFAPAWPHTVASYAGSPNSRCSLAPSFDWMSTGWPSKPPVHSRLKWRVPLSGHASAQVTVHYLASPGKWMAFGE